MVVRFKKGVQYDLRAEKQARRQQEPSDDLLKGIGERLPLARARVQIVWRQGFV